MAKEKQIIDITKLKPWEKNAKHEPSAQEIERLKKQLLKYGQLDPIVTNEEGTVLGGHTRLRAMKELGMDKVWVTTVNAPTEAKMLEYALSDNDRAGFTSDQMLAELIEAVGRENLNLEDYYVKLSEGASLEFLRAQAQKIMQGEGTVDPNRNSEKMAAYLANPNKQIVLFFTDEEYDEFIAKWSDLKTRFDLNDNVAAVKQLLYLNGK